MRVFTAVVCLFLCLEPIDGFRTIGIGRDTVPTLPALYVNLPRSVTPAGGVWPGYYLWGTNSTVNYDRVDITCDEFSCWAMASEYTLPVSFPYAMDGFTPVYPGQLVSNSFWNRTYWVVGIGAAIDAAVAEYNNLQGTAITCAATYVWSTASTILPNYTAASLGDQSGGTSYSLIGLKQTFWPAYDPVSGSIRIVCEGQVLTLDAEYSQAQLPWIDSTQVNATQISLSTIQTYRRSVELMILTVVPALVDDETVTYFVKYSTVYVGSCQISVCAGALCANTTWEQVPGQSAAEVTLAGWEAGTVEAGLFLCCGHCVEVVVPVDTSRCKCVIDSSPSGIGCSYCKHPSMSIGVTALVFVATFAALIWLYHYGYLGLIYSGLSMCLAPLKYFWKAMGAMVIKWGKVASPFWLAFWGGVGKTASAAGILTPSGPQIVFGTDPANYTFYTSSPAYTGCTAAEEAQLGLVFSGLDGWTVSTVPIASSSVTSCILDGSGAVSSCSVEFDYTVGLGGALDDVTRFTTSSVTVSASQGGGTAQTIAVTPVEYGVIHLGTTVSPNFEYVYTTPTMTSLWSGVLTGAVRENADLNSANQTIVEETASRIASGAGYYTSAMLAWDTFAPQWCNDYDTAADITSYVNAGTAILVDNNLYKWPRSSGLVTVAVPYRFANGAQGPSSPMSMLPSVGNRTGACTYSGPQAAQCTTTTSSGGLTHSASISCATTARGPTDDCDIFPTGGGTLGYACYTPQDWSSMMHVYKAVAGGNVPLARFATYTRVASGNSSMLTAKCVSRSPGDGSASPVDAHMSFSVSPSWSTQTSPEFVQSNQYVFVGAALPGAKVMNGLSGYIGPGVGLGASVPTLPGMLQYIGLPLPCQMSYPRTPTYKGCAGTADSTTCDVSVWDIATFTTDAYSDLVSTAVGSGFPLSAFSLTWSATPTTVPVSTCNHSSPAQVANATATTLIPNLLVAYQVRPQGVLVSMTGSISLSALSTLVTPAFAPTIAFSAVGQYGGGSLVTVCFSALSLTESGIAPVRLWGGLSASDVGVGCRLMAQTATPCCLDAVAAEASGTVVISLVGSNGASVQSAAQSFNLTFVDNGAKFKRNVTTGSNSYITSDGGSSDFGGFFDGLGRGLGDLADDAADSLGLADSALRSLGSGILGGIMVIVLWLLAWVVGPIVGLVGLYVLFRCIYALSRGNKIDVRQYLRMQRALEKADKSTLLPVSESSKSSAIETGDGVRYRGKPR